jgi:hypothetical protein
MRFYQYKPAEYVNVHPDIPLEWMQGQVNTAQKRYDLQKEAVDKATENWLNVKYGELGKAEYDRLKQQYEGRFTSINDMLNVGNVMGASKDFSNLIRETAMDPGLKNLQEEYKAYSEYQKNLLNPEFAGSVNPLPYAIQAGLQMGEELPLSQALQYYQLAKPQNSLEDVEKTIQSFKPSTVDGVTWTIKDPLTGQTITGSEGDIKGVFEERLRQTLDSYYNNWVISGKSLNDKRRILQEEGLDPIKDMGVFNTPQGKQLYDKYSKFLLGYAYQEKIPPPDQTTTGGTKAGTKTGTTQDDKPTINPITATTYGYRNGNGSIFNKVNNNGTVEPVNLDSREGYDLSIEYLLDERESLIAEMENLRKSGGSVEEKKALDEKIKQNERMSNILANEQKSIEANLYLTPTDTVKIEAAKQQANREWLNVQSQRTDSKVGESIKITPAEKSKWIDNKVLEILGKDSLEGKLIERYNQYNNDYLTSGKAYMLLGTDNIKLLTGIMQNFQNKTIKYKDPLTDQETNIDDINAIIPKNEDGVPDYERLSYEMLLDERDGPVLVIHGVDEENKSKAYEVRLENFGNVRQFFANILTPEEQAYMTKFVEATQSIKASENKNMGSFNVNRFDGSTNEIDFNREKIGGGKYAYRVENSSDGTKGKIYGSMEEMIYGEILPYSMEDTTIKQNYEKMMAAVKRNDYQTASEQMAIINKLMTDSQLQKAKASSKSESPTTLGKQNPQTNSNPLGLGK